MLALVVVALAVVITLVTQSSTSPDKPYTEFLADVKAGNVTSIIQEGSKLTVTPKSGATYTVVVPGLLAEALPDITAAAVAGGVPVPELPAKPPADTSWLGLIVKGMLPILIIGGFIFFIVGYSQGPRSQALTF